MQYDEGVRLRRVVVCPPGKAFAGVGTADLTAHNFRGRVDGVRAAEQHATLVELLMAADVRVMSLVEPAGQPNAVYTRDVAVALAQGYIRMGMGLPTRQAEAAWMSVALMAHGLAEVGRIEAPGTAEGGDVILAGTVAFVGLSSRTNAAGARQLTLLLEAMGYAVRSVRVPPPSLHLGGVMSVIGPGRLLACTDVLPKETLAGFEVVAIAKREFISGNVITVGPGEVIAEQRNEQAIAALSHAGVRVHALDLWEFVRGGGGPSCLVLPLERG